MNGELKDFIGKILDTLLYRVELLYKSAWLMSPRVRPQIAKVATLCLVMHQKNACPMNYPTVKNICRGVTAFPAVAHVHVIKDELLI